MKAHNIEKKDLLNPRDASVASTKVKKGEVKAGTAAAANKKRKVVEADLANDDEDDEETVPAMKKKRFKKEKAVKSEDGVNSEDEAMSQAKVKDEDSESAGVPQVDGASDICFVKEEAAVTTKSQPGAAVKSEPVWEPMATNNIHAIEYEPIYDQLLQPGDFSQTIIIAD